MEKDLQAIGQQLQYVLDELQNENPDMDLIQDWVKDPLLRVKKLLGQSPDPSDNDVCELYENDETTAMNCKHCGQPQFMHYNSL